MSSGSTILKEKALAIFTEHVLIKYTWGEKVTKRIINICKKIFFMNLFQKKYVLFISTDMDIYFVK